MPSSPGTYTFGFRICNDQNPYNSTQNVVKFLDPSSATQLSFSTVSGGSIAVTLGDTATLLGTSSGTNLSQNVWSYVELQMLCNGSTGTVAIRINGSTVLNLTGQNTKGSGTTTNIGSIKIGSNITPLFQSLYITNSSGSHNTGFLGDVQMPISLANANGSYTAWTPNGAATIYQSVNASTPADSTVFVSDSTPETASLLVTRAPALRAPLWVSATCRGCLSLQAESGPFRKQSRMAGAIKLLALWHWELATGTFYRLVNRTLQLRFRGPSPVSTVSRQVARRLANEDSKCLFYKPSAIRI